MNFLSRLPRIPTPAVFRPAHPSLAAEIGEGGLAFARLGRDGSRASLAGFHVGEVPAGAIRLSSVHVNVLDQDAVRAQVRAAKARLAPTGGPIALCVPDPVARVALLQLDAMPARDAEVQELVAWRLKKQLPYRVDEARVSWQVVGSKGGATSVVAAAMRNRVLAEYEDLLRDEGFDVGAVTTSTLALVEALPPHEGDTLLVHAADGWFTLFWASASQPLLLRTKQLPASDREGTARDAAITAEIPPTIEYARQRLGRTGDLEVMVHDASGRGSELAEVLRETCAVPVSLIRATPQALLPAGVAERLGASCGLAARGLGEGISLHGERTA